MARTAPYLFYRYDLTLNDEVIGGPGHYGFLESFKGRTVAHRKANPTLQDADTFLLLLKEITIDGAGAIGWRVGRHIELRQVDRYVSAHDRLEHSFETTNECQTTRFVAIPSLGVAAVEDRSSDRHVGGKAAVSRMRSIIRSFKGADIDLVAAGSPSDVATAVRTWNLGQVSFVVRPFNPTLRRPGDDLHRLLDADHAGKLSASVTPAEGHAMRAAEGGIINEAVGLADAGYGQIGAEGTTPDGYRAKIAKPPFSPDKTVNLERQAEERSLKVYVEAPDDEDSEAEAVAGALMSFFQVPEPPLDQVAAPMAAERA